MNYKKTVLVLGCQGMTGHTVFQFLKQKTKLNVFGSTRKKAREKDIFCLSVEACEKDFLRIVKRVKKIDFVINCIGILTQFTSFENLIKVNALFPHELSRLSEKYKFQIIHISSDAVFSKTSRTVYEESNPSPQNYYGASKFLGEIQNPLALTVRTSLIGFDRFQKKGLLEWVKKTEEEKITGFNNQLWSGCTTLQFAQFCEYLIDTSFQTIRAETSIIHFTPIQKTKYEIVLCLSKILGLRQKIKKGQGEPINRILKTRYMHLIKQSTRSESLSKALSSLIGFERSIIPL